MFVSVELYQLLIQYWTILAKDVNTLEWGARIRKIRRSLIDRNLANLNGKEQMRASEWDKLIKDTHMQIKRV